MDRILIILKKENGPRASSSPALGLNTIIFKHVYWYMQQISGEHLQGHWSSGFTFGGQEYKFFLKNLRVLFAFVQTLQICVVCDSYTQVFYASNIFQYSSLKGVISLYFTRPFICQLHHVAFDGLKSHFPFPSPTA